MRIRKTSIRGILIFASVLLFSILAGFILVPLSYGSGEQYISQATLQLARSNGFAKNALLLQDSAQDKPTHDQALSDMEVALPLFEQEQNALLKDNRQDIQDSLQQARSSYLALVASTQSVIARVDPAQISIIVLNNRTYNIAMNQFLTILQSRAKDGTLHIVLIDEFVLILMFACFVWLWTRHREVVR